MADDPYGGGDVIVGGYPAGTTAPTWSCPSTPEECCAGKVYTSYWFCMMMCVLCCCTVKLGRIQTNGLGPRDPVKPGIRDFPEFTIEGGVSFTKSNYGEFIPIVFGSDKLDGNVFWYSGFEDHIIVTGEEQVLYRTVSFALGICEGEIDAVLRMWVGNQLILDNSGNVDENGVMQPNSDGFIFGATVDMISPESPLSRLPDKERRTRISVFTGSETQLPEAAIGNIEGFEATPAYRGLAYVLFENFICEETTVPSLFVEVMANTSGLFPRLYYDLPTPQVEFDQLSGQLVTYDPGYDHYIVRGLDDGGTKRGYVIIDGNTLEEIRQIEVVLENDIPSSNWAVGQHLYTSNGHIVAVIPDGNFGITYVINLVTGLVDDSKGPGGGLGGHNLVSGFATPSTASLISSYGLSGMPVDILCVAGSVNASVGFAEISASNKITMRSTFNSVLYGTINTVVPMKVFADFAAEFPTFIDGGNTQGAHFFVFSTGGTERDQIAIRRFTIDGSGATIEDPIMGDEVYIDLDLINGKGFVHAVAQIDLDIIDNCYVLHIFSGNVSATRPHRLIKWSPFTGEVVWNVAIPIGSNGSQRQSAPRSIIVNQIYGLYGGDNRLYSVDLADGSYTIAVDDLSDQALPVKSGDNHFYNSYDNSLTWVSTTTDKRLTKVFLNRISRSNVAVSTIVTTLLRRVGLDLDQVNVDDLQSLTLDGFTVMQPSALRDIFSQLAQVFRFDIVESNGAVLYKARGGAATETIPAKYLAETDGTSWLTETRDEDFSRVRKINLTYRDIDREYMQNVQSIQLPKYAGADFDEDAAIDVNVPLVLTADKAKTLAEILLYSKIVYSSQFEGRLPQRYLTLDPADVVELEMSDTESITVRMRDVTIGTDKSVQFRASREDPDIYTDVVNLFGSVGRFTGSNINPLQPRLDPHIMLFPFRNEEDARSVDSSYLMFLTLLNHRITQPLEKPMTVVMNGNEQSIVVNPPTTYPTWGYVITPALPRTARYSTDFDGFIDVAIVNEGPLGMPSAAASLEAMIDNDQINLACVGLELIQFQNVTSLGDGKYRLEVLNRCLFGSDGGSASHESGEKFVLLADATGALDETSILRLVVEPLSSGPRKVTQVFLPTNNPWQPAPLSFFLGLNLRPFPIADFRGVYGAADLTLTWERVARYGGVWDDLDETITPTEPGEEYELYLFTDFETFSLRDPTTYLRMVEVTEPSFVYTDAMQVADGFNRLTTTLYCMIHATASLTEEDQGITTVHPIFPKE
jgi:hypothetical protein